MIDFSPDNLRKRHVALPKPDPLPPGDVALVDLAENGCRWPKGEGPFVFCNHPQVEGFPYCQAHCRIGYRDPEPRFRPSYR